MKPATKVATTAPAPAPATDDQGNAEDSATQYAQECARLAALALGGLKPNALGLVTLEDVCPLLGMTFVVARRHHSDGTLPVKAFRLASSRRGPLFVHIDDLEHLIAKRRTKAAKIFDQSRNAGLI
jgi:hypothetical protein